MLMLVTFALSYALLGWALPNVAASRIEAADTAPAPAPAAASSLRRVTLIVAKMECPPCASHARSMLKRQPFVQAFFAESGIDQVTVDYDSRQIDAAGVVKLFPHYYGVTLVSDLAAG
jgi:hypothetical protein